jgi:ribosomal protein S3
VPEYPGTLLPPCSWCAIRYRRLRTYFAKTKHWNQFDPFFTQKADTYKSSSTAIIRKLPGRVTSRSSRNGVLIGKRDAHLLDLAKSLKKLDGEQDDLLQGYKEKGSAMEVVF